MLCIINPSVLDKINKSGRYWNASNIAFEIRCSCKTIQAAAHCAPRLLGGNVENVGKTRSYVRGMWKLQTVVITIIMSWDITRGGNDISWHVHSIWRRHFFKVNHQWVQTRRTWCEHFAKIRWHLKWATVRSLELVTKLWCCNESVQRVTWLVTARLWSCCWFLDKLLGIKISFII